MTLHTINTELFKLDGGAMFGVVPKSIWQKLNPPDVLNMCTWAMRCMLIEDGKTLTLIDTGIGNKQSEKFFGHYHLDKTNTLEKSINALGYTKNDITTVILTHLHFDHCGGAVEIVNEKLKPTFINATYYTNANHWQWAIQPNDREKASFLADNILPLQAAGQLQYIDISAYENIGTTIAFTKGVQVKIANGHTRSMMLPVITYKGYTIVYMADLLPSAAHIPLPYIMAYDMFPMQTLLEKKQFLQLAADHNYLLYFEHDPVHELCSVHYNDKGQVVVKDYYKLSEL